MARPTKLTDAVQETIVRAIRAGAYVETAAAFAGIEKKTFYNWLKRGRTEAKYRAFLHAIEKAEAEWEVRDSALVGEAAKTQWQAAAWRLERKRPERWGRRIQASVTALVAPLIIDAFQPQDALPPHGDDADDD